MADGINASAIQVKNYFGYKSTKEFMDEWKALPSAKQAQIKAGIGNGSMSY